MSTIHIVQGVHWTTPGTPMIPCASEFTANEEAARLVNTLAKDVQDDDGQPLATATPENWEAVLADLRKATACGEDGDCDVWITELEVKG